MTSYTRRWILAGPLTRAARHRRGGVERLAGWRKGRYSGMAGRSKVWREAAQRVPVEIRRERA